MTHLYRVNTGYEDNPLFRCMKSSPMMSHWMCSWEKTLVLYSYPFSLSSMEECNAMSTDIANTMMDNTINFRFSTKKGQWQRSACKAQDIQVYLLCQALLLERKITKNNADFCKFHSISKFSHCSSLTFIRTHGNAKDRTTEEEGGWKSLHSTHAISSQIIRERDASVYYIDMHFLCLLVHFHVILYS